MDPCQGALTCYVVVLLRQLLHEPLIAEVQVLVVAPYGR